LKIPRSRYEEVETGTERQRLMSKGKVELGKTYRREKKLSRKSFVNCSRCPTETSQFDKLKTQPIRTQPMVRLN